MRRGLPTLADAADPLGKLQRGLGSGYLWALDADRAVGHALLLHCVFNDPRWDRQLDDRDDYHATLALDLRLPTSALELWLRDSDEDDPDTTGDVLGMLGRMAARGHADARRALREYVAYGRSWPRAIDELVGDYDAASGASSWPEVVAGLDAVLVERFATGDALAEALTGIDPRERPWTMWSVENPRIARALAIEQPRGGAGGGSGAGGGGPALTAAPPSSATKRRTGARQRGSQPRAGPRPREMSTATLLRIAEDSRWTQIADELATRTASADVELLLAAAGDPAVPMRRAAILALGRQGHSELLQIAEQNTKAERDKLQGAIALALEAMPLSQTRALAHDWLTSTDWARRRKAAGILATHAEDDDLAPARSALTRELDHGLDGDVYVICSLAQALGRSALHGPYDELLRAYEEIPYSYGRRYIVAALAASDPMFAADAAVECLWDCEAQTRALAATHVDHRVRLAAQRLDELTADQAQAASVRLAADGRLRS
ncbi:MAG: hypothetical protein Q8O56_15365 [Solirubrobacteraceae bacterium]|nr:hypothetical protein [Solirubrobacteraceae bacterium]